MEMGYYFDCGSGCIDLYICQNSLNCTLKSVSGGGSEILLQYKILLKKNMNYI
jgi:hypothetical protein